MIIKNSLVRAKTTIVKQYAATNSALEKFLIISGQVARVQPDQCLSDGIVDKAYAENKSTTIVRYKSQLQQNT